MKAQWQSLIWRKPGGICSMAAILGMANHSKVINIGYEMATVNQ
jgi:hypothetical protein